VDTLNVAAHIAGPPKQKTAGIGSIGFMGSIGFIGFIRAMFSFDSLSLSFSEFSKLGSLPIDSI
jgi:hypothetical protein